MASYAKRLFQIENPDSKSIYMGVSFGGMIAQEWAKIQTPAKLILISTTDDYLNIQPAFRISGKLGLHHLLHPKIALIFAPITYWIFGVKSKQDKEMMRNILRDTDPNFFRWATDSLLRWHIEMSPNTLRIHGKKDRIIAVPSNINFETKGGHFTIFCDGEEITTFIQNQISP